MVAQAMSAGWWGYLLTVCECSETSAWAVVRPEMPPPTTTQSYTPSSAAESEVGGEFGRVVGGAAAAMTAPALFLCSFCCRGDPYATFRACVNPPLVTRVLNRGSVLSETCNAGDGMLGCGVFSSNLCEHHTQYRSLCVGTHSLRLCSDNKIRCSLLSRYE